MPEGVILSSASPGATQEAVHKVLADHGLEVEQPEQTEVVVEAPKRDDFETDEEFESATVEFEDAKKAAEEQEDEEEDDEEEEEAAAPKKPSRGARKFQKRVAKFTAPLERKIAELEEKLKTVGKTEPEKKDPPPDPNPRPKRADFKNDEEYENALVKWGVKQAKAETELEDATKNEQQRLQKAWETYQANAEVFKETHDDWDELTSATKMKDIPMHTSVQLAVIEQENGPAVIYYLAKHPEYTKKLATMTPLSAVMEVGRLSERLLKKADAGSPSPGSGRGAQPKPKQKVPPPVKPVNTSATSSSETSKDAAAKKDYKAFKKLQSQGR